MKTFSKLACVVACASLLGCAAGRPPGFSEGDHWSFPLVGADESGPILVPVFLDGKGPYLFQIDPDLMETSIDSQLRSELGLLPRRGKQVRTQADNLQPVAMAMLGKLRIGELEVTMKDPIAVRVGPWTVRGRVVRGVLGRDIITESLVFGIDRDRGRGHLWTQEAFKAPPDASKIEYSRRYQTETQDYGRNLAEIKYGEGKEATVHLDLGTPISQLWASKLKAFERVTATALVIDEIGYRSKSDYVARVPNVSVDGVSAKGAIYFMPFQDERIRDFWFDGELGLDFFGVFNIYANWHRREWYLTTPERDPRVHAAERVARWGQRFAKCDHTGCAEVKLSRHHKPNPMCTNKVAPEPAPSEKSPATPSPSAEPTAARCSPGPISHHILSVTRADETLDIAYELILAPVFSNGKVKSVRYRLTMPAGKKHVVTALRDPWLAKISELVVVDVTPFPAKCKRETCILLDTR